VPRTVQLLLAALVLAAAAPSPALATGVLVMDRHGRVHRANDRFLPAKAASALPTPTGRRARAAPAPVPRVRGGAAQARRRTVRSELRRLGAAGAIQPADRRAWQRAYDRSRSLLPKLSGARRRDLGAVIATVDRLAAAGRLTAGRAPALFLTLDNNRRWWASGPLLSYGRRVEFKGSQLVWQYYTGAGLEIQWLGTFGKANGLYGSHQDAALRALAGEAVALATPRAGGRAWEYLFTFDGGAPPWISAISQGTGIQALARAGTRFQDPAMVQAARDGLGAFRAAPPEGLAVPTEAGTNYLMYSFAPNLQILNGFVQSLNGLFDYTKLTGDAAGAPLFAAGEAQLRAALGAFDTGAWSLYSLQREAPLSYHQLVIVFLRNLCKRLGEAPELAASGIPAPVADPAIYCAAADRFTAYEHQPPAISLARNRPIARVPARIRFTLSKISTVTTTLVRAGRTVYFRRLQMARGPHSLLYAPRVQGPLTLRVHAVDLAGNAADVTRELDVRPARPRR
jgi:D-glucuronyl C5-epimerase C-terminus